jgi:hypothetical protein
MTEHRFCPKSCLFSEDFICPSECHHFTDIVYREPIKAVLNYTVPEEIEIIGENRAVICQQNGVDIGPTWYVRNSRGEVSGIMYDNPLVTIGDEVYVPQPRPQVRPNLGSYLETKKRRRKKRH